MYSPQNAIPDVWKRISPRLFMYGATKAVAINLAAQAAPG